MRRGEARRLAAAAAFALAYPAAWIAHLALSVALAMRLLDVCGGTLPTGAEIRQALGPIGLVAGCGLATLALARAAVGTWAAGIASILAPAAVLAPLVADIGGLRGPRAVSLGRRRVRRAARARDPRRGRGVVRGRGAARARRRPARLASAPGPA